MNETQNTNGLLKVFQKVNTAHSLRNVRKLLQVFSILLIITACVDLYTTKFVLSLSNVGTLVLAGLMMNFVQRIEVILLKKKINAWLMKNESMNIVDSRE